MKKGISLTSLVIYVSLFFILSVFATSMTTNLNHGILNEKGNIVNNENYLKLYSNMLSSAKNSKQVDNISNNITFSNGDIYEYNKEKQIITKNGGLFCTNVLSFEVINSSEIFNGLNLQSNKGISIKVTFKKYTSLISRNILVCVGDDANEE